MRNTDLTKKTQHRKLKNEKHGPHQKTQHRKLKR